jgi:uncharacterized protein YjeT (DUF2065 family)
MIIVGQILNFIFSLALIVLGFLAALYPAKVRDAFLQKAGVKEGSRPFRIAQKKWYLLNLRICGVVGIFIGLIVTYCSVALLFKK